MIIIIICFDKQQNSLILHNPLQQITHFDLSTHISLENTEPISCIPLFQNYQNTSYRFYPAPLKGSGVKRQTGPVNTVTSTFFTDHFQTWQGHSLPKDHGRVWLCRFCLIKYAHDGPFHGLISFGIPGLICQTKITKFGITVGLNMVISITSMFSHSPKQNFVIFFSNFPISHIKNNC